jgi:hypothetical protein
LPKPQGTGGHFGETVGEFLGNPISYLGPGSLGAKLFGTIASAVGSETAGQLAKGTWLEPFARIGGAIVAGGAAGSAFNRGRAAGERAPPEESGPHDAGPRPSPSADELKYVEDAPPTVPVQLPVGPDDIAAFRARHQLPDDLDTFGVARTNIPGLEDEPFEGAAPAVRDRVGWPRMEPGEISSPSADPRGQWHAEEDLINQVHNKIKALRLRPDDLAGHELSMYLSQPPCPTCLSGFGRNPDAEVGVLKKFSTLYPKLTIHVGADTPEGPIYFTIRNGTYRTWRYP